MSANTHDWEERATHLMHGLMHSEAGKEALKNVGHTMAAAGTALLATPAAPLVLGTAAVVGTIWGIKKLAAWLNS